MSAPVRFLVVLAAGWVGVRAMTLGAVPGFTASYAQPASARALPPVAATRFQPLPPVEMGQPQQPYPYAYGYPYANPYPPPPWPAGAAAALPYYVPHPAAPGAPYQPIPARAEWSLPPHSAGPEFFSPIEPIDRWEVAELAAFPERRSRPVPQAIGGPAAHRPLDRLQMSSWALLRGSPSPGALAAGGTLGGSQAGARLLYAFDRRLGVSVRTTSPVGGSRGAEVAAGLRLTPFAGIPVAFTAERRQSISPHGGGRSAFAFFAEGGLYRQPMPWRFELDAYLQAGVVGLNSRGYFADGALTFTRPVHGRFSAGFGIWGGAQPGIHRIDAGPRVSMRLRDNIYAHADWRQRIAGTAEPSSGPALTLAADF